MQHLTWLPMGDACYFMGLFFYNGGRCSTLFCSTSKWPTIPLPGFVYGSQNLCSPVVYILFTMWIHICILYCDYNDTYLSYHQQLKGLLKKRNLWNALRYCIPWCPSLLQFLRFPVVHIHMLTWLIYYLCKYTVSVTLNANNLNF